LTAGTLTAAEAGPRVKGKSRPRTGTPRQRKLSW